MAAQKKTLWVGDKWQIAVRYRTQNPDGTYTPFTFNADRVPAAEVYLGSASTMPLDCTIANGRCIVLDQTQDETKGSVIFQLHASEVPNADVFKKTSNYNRLQAILLDSAGERSTQSVTELDIRIAQTGDIVTGVSYSTELVTVIGGGGGQGGGGGTIVRRPVNSVSSYTIAHNFDYQPDVWAVDDTGEGQEVDYEYVGSTVAFTFSPPFTGTLYLA